MRYIVKGGLYAQLEAVQPQVLAPNVESVVAQSLTFGKFLIEQTERDAIVFATLGSGSCALSLDTPPPFPPCVSPRCAYDSLAVRFSRGQWDTVERLTQRAGFAHPRDFLRGSIRNYLFGAATLARGGYIVCENPSGTVGRVTIRGLFGQ